ncbi:uncharacterized protein Dwil_GK26958 [Drosophila willistoni]|nr:uncharacterized protein Dwil_GK26958 [Drosophila willistoni]
MPFRRIIICLLVFSYADAVIWKFTNAVCLTYDERYIVNNCRLKAIKRDRVVFNYNATMLEAAHKVSVHTKVLKKANGYKPWIIDFTLDCCRFHRKNYNPFVIMIYNMFKEYSNINHTCPFEVSCH